jgi:hypothetical protein
MIGSRYPTNRPQSRAVPGDWALRATFQRKKLENDGR